MSTANAFIVSKVWSFCNTLRDDGVGYGDYLERWQNYPGANGSRDCGQRPCKP